MTITHDHGTELHDPSAPPDPKALFSRLAAFSARHRRGVIGCGCSSRSRPHRSR